MIKEYYKWILSKSSDFKPLVFKLNITPVDVIKNKKSKIYPKD